MTMPGRIDRSASADRKTSKSLLNPGESDPARNGSLLKPLAPGPDQACYEFIALQGHSVSWVMQAWRQTVKARGTPVPAIFRCRSAIRASGPLWTRWASRAHRRATLYEGSNGCWMFARSLHDPQRGTKRGGRPTSRPGLRPDCGTSKTCWRRQAATAKVPQRAADQCERGGGTLAAAPRDTRLPRAALARDARSGLGGRLGQIVADGFDAGVAS